LLRDAIARSGSTLVRQAPENSARARFQWNLAKHRRALIQSPDFRRLNSPARNVKEAAMALKQTSFSRTSGFTKKGSHCYLDMKAHIGVDAENALIHSLTPLRRTLPTSLKQQRFCTATNPGNLVIAKKRY
jgi:IS5 family transposase